MGVAHLFSRCPLTSLTTFCESGWRETGKKRARGEPGHAQLKGVNRLVAAVGAARRGAHQDIDESLRRGVFSTKRDVITPSHPASPFPFRLPSRTGCNNRLSAMSPLAAPNPDLVKDAPSIEKYRYIMGLLIAEKV